jgi:hypothetical protein
MRCTLQRQEAFAAKAEAEETKAMASPAKRRR